MTAFEGSHSEPQSTAPSYDWDHEGPWPTDVWLTNARGGCRYIQSGAAADADRRVAELEDAIGLMVRQTRGLRDKCDDCRGACQHTATAYSDVVAIARGVIG